MTSKIRDATEEEKGLAIKFSDKLSFKAKGLVEELEEEGFRVIYEKGQKNCIPILTPSGQTLIWNLCPGNLDALGQKNSELDLEKSACYLGFVFHAYMKKQGVYP
jgi:hypothetical protein